MASALTITKEFCRISFNKSYEARICILFSETVLTSIVLVFDVNEPIKLFSMNHFAIVGMKAYRMRLLFNGIHIL